MIISHKYKFIFIKTTKTAGTSIEVDLSKVLGESDISTPIKPEVDGHIARNYKYKKYGFLTREYYNHMPGREIRNIVGRRVFDEYYKFCVEREPVEKCLSQFSMLKKSSYHNSSTKEMTWDQYIENRKFPVDSGKFTSATGELLVDRILKFENLSDELYEVGRSLGFELRLETKAKSGFRMEFDVSERHREIIYAEFSESNRFTGYSL